VFCWKKKLKIGRTCCHNNYAIKSFPVRKAAKSSAANARISLGVGHLVRITRPPRQHKIKVEIVVRHINIEDEVELEIFEGMK
jgi:hypothetical protein